MEDAVNSLESDIYHYSESDECHNVFMNSLRFIRAYITLKTFIHHSFLRILGLTDCSAVSERQERWDRSPQSRSSSILTLSSLSVCHCQTAEQQQLYSRYSRDEYWSIYIRHGPPTLLIDCCKITRSSVILGNKSCVLSVPISVTHGLLRVVIVRHSTLVAFL